MLVLNNITERYFNQQMHPQIHFQLRHSKTNSEINPRKVSRKRVNNWRKHGIKPRIFTKKSKPLHPTPTKT